MAFAIAFVFVMTLLAVVAFTKEVNICAPEMFAFADSLSDTGNLCTTAPSLCLAGLPPYGQDFPTHRPNGRFSNGYNILDYVARAFSLPLIDPYFQTVNGNYTHGINFANAGCTATFDDASVLPPPGRNPFVFAIQISEFLRIQQIVDKTYRFPGINSAALPSRHSFQRALYYVELGGNDINYNNLVRKLSPADMISQVVPAVMDAISHGIETLIKAKAKNFIIFGLPMQGCAPLNLALGKSLNDTDLDEFGCLHSYNRISQEYNKQLKSVVDNLRTKHSRKGAHFILVDYYGLHQGMINGTLGSFNETNVLNACCGPKQFEYNCLTPPDQVVGCRCTSQDVCSNPDEYLVWDGIHFTQEFSRVAVDAMFQRDSPYLDTGSPHIKISRTCNM